jgi:long-subunit fatty acid transport protein
MRGTLIGALLPLPFTGALQNRVALGFSFFTPTNVVVRGRVLYPDSPQFPLIADRAQSVTIQAGLGLDLGRGFRLGAGVSALAAISGTVIVATDSSGSVGTKVDDQLVASYAPLAGVSYDLGDSYRLGVTYRGRLEARFAVRIEVYDLGSLTVPPFNIAGLAQFDPWQVQAEVARVRGPWKVAVGATFKRWSGYPGAPEPTVLCPPEKPECLALRPAPPGFQDTVVPRVGVERTVVDRSTWGAAARAGYFLEPSPAPEQQRTGRFFDATRHALTLGGGLELRGSVPLSLDVFTQGHLLASRTHRIALDEAGTSRGQAKTSGFILVGGLTASVRF